MCGCFDNGLEIFGKQLGKRFVVNESGSANQKVFVVAGKTFKEPQQRRVGLFREVGANKGCGFNAFHKPRVEVFVCKKCEQLHVIVGAILVMCTG